MSKLEFLSDNSILLKIEGSQSVKFLKPLRLNKKSLVLPVRINENMINAISLNHHSFQEVNIAII